jgi:hypothetical protein
MDPILTRRNAHFLPEPPAGWSAPRLSRRSLKSSNWPSGAVVNTAVVLAPCGEFCVPYRMSDFRAIPRQHGQVADNEIESRMSTNNG